LEDCTPAVQFGRLHSFKQGRKYTTIFFF